MPSLPAQHELLDGVGHVRDHLHGAAEIVAAPLAGKDLLVEPPGGDVVGLLRAGTPVKRS